MQSMAVRSAGSWAVVRTSTDVAKVRTAYERSTAEANRLPAPFNSGSILRFVRIAVVTDAGLDCPPHECPCVSITGLLPPEIDFGEHRNIPIAQSRRFTELP